MPVMKEFEHKRILSTTDKRTVAVYRIRFSKRIVFGSMVLALIAAIAILAPRLAPITYEYSPLSVHLDHINLPPYSPGHLFGTDYLGRDVFAEAIWGSRASLIVGLFAALIAVSFGSIWGSLSAFAGGIVDTLMMRIVDGLLSIPSIILLLALNALLSAPSIVAGMPQPLLSLLHITSYSFGNLPIVTVVAVISATTWLEAARISRAKITSVKAEEYIEAAQALGMSTPRMLFQHLLPNAASVLMVEATLLVSDAVLMESGLSFLGLGLGPSNPSWGSMLTAAQISLTQGNWWAVFIPGLLITLTVGSVNLIGEGWLEMLGRRHPAA
ncbi:MAG: ABC transporter permease [Candidatus Melainabacteria bacterium]|nr:ABC transporter permease [Candidatus Melainabacteria bacterium]